MARTITDLPTELRETYDAAAELIVEDAAAREHAVRSGASYATWRGRVTDADVAERSGHDLSATRNELQDLAEDLLEIVTDDDVRVTGLGKMGER